MACHGVLWSRASAATAAVALGLLISGCGGEPFSYVKVKGKVTYEDGTPIPAPRLKVTFVPQVPPRDSKTHPRRGVAYPDAATGEFDAVTSHTYGDGLVRGEHKVLVQALDAMERPVPGLVPPEYGDPEKTPLTADTARPDSFVLKVPKPAGR